MTIHYIMEVDWMDLVESLGRPASLRPDGLATPLFLPKQTTTDFRRQSGASMRRAAPNGENPRLASLGEAVQPHFATSRPQLWCGS